MPVNERVELGEDSAYEYIDGLIIEDALSVRFTDEDGDIEDVYKLIHEVANQNHIKLDSSFIMYA